MENETLQRGGLLIFVSVDFIGQKVFVTNIHVLRSFCSCLTRGFHTASTEETLVDTRNEKRGGGYSYDRKVN